MIIEQAFVTTDIIAIESIVMSQPRIIPGAWGRVSYKTKNIAGDYSDVDSTSIVVKDITDTTRVGYSNVNLVNDDTGEYHYDFQIPEIVLSGQWRVEISCTIGSRTAIRNVFFEVREVNES